ncbi:MAG: hypothetical protein LBB45_02235 [Methanobrevibacter sp.]|nr:hypothetical protein [Candidatus Methanovirga basalitermitum]
MFEFENYLFNGMKIIDPYNYVLVDGKFTRDGKMNIKDYINFITFNKGKTLSLETNNYMNEKYGFNNITITKTSIL